MKSTTRLLLSTLFLLALASQLPAAAQTSASGTYRFTLTDDLLRSLEFDARTDERGTTTGRMILNDETRVEDKDDEGDPDPRPGDGLAVSFAADFDNMTVEKNRAVMSGTVIDSTHRIYIGRWVQLVVEDNGIDPRRPDRLVWTLCRPEPGGWVPSDYDQPGDNGAYLKWWATDAERKDDAGIPSRNIIPGERKGCEVYTLASYDWAAVKKFDGDIVVVP